jgi:hypothetical protein
MTGSGKDVSVDFFCLKLDFLKTGTSSSDSKSTGGGSDMISK